MTIKKPIDQITPTKNGARIDDVGAVFERKASYCVLFSLFALA